MSGRPAAGPPLKRATHATRLQFAALGLLGGVWGAHIPSVKAQYALDEAALAVVLLAAALGSVAALFGAGRIVARLGARGATALAGGVMCTLLALVLLWPERALLLAAMVVFGAALSLFDVAINTEGTELESRSGRTVMSQLHAMFSVGGMVGAGLVAALLHAGLAPPLQLAAIAPVTALAVLLASRQMLPTHAAQDGDRASFAWPRGRLLVIGLLIFAGMSAEGVMYDWSVLYLKQELAQPQARAALGFAVFSGAMAAARFGGDTLRARFPERQLLRVGGTLAALTMAAVLVVADARFALLGFAVVGAGLAPVVPVLFNAATRVPGVSRAAAIAAVSAIGYSGLMIGPPLIGGIAQHSSLSWAMAVVVVAAGLLALGARSVPDKG